MFKICVVGCGGMSRSGHGPSVAKYKKDYKDVQLSACCDLNEERAMEYKEKFGFETYYTDYVKMIEDIQPDVVCLMSPVDFTCELSINIMKMGCNIIMEKPPGRNLEEINRMIAVAKETGVNVRCAFNRRYIPLILELKKQLEEAGEKVFNVTYHMYRKNRTEDDFSTTAIHAVDVVKNIIGSDYKKVEFSYQHLPELGEIAKNIYMSCEFENGAHATIDIVPVGGAVFERLSVNTHNHTYYLNLPVWGNTDCPGTLAHHTPEEEPLIISGETVVDNSENMFEVSGFYDENRLFFEHLRNNDFVTCDLETAIQSVEIEDCIRHSIKEYNK